MALVRYAAARFRRSTRVVVKAMACAALAGLLLALMPAAAIGDVSGSSLQPGEHKAGVCVREAVTLVGTKAMRVDGKIRAPKKRRHVDPSYPKLPPDTVGTGSWMGEALIDARGRVREVWAVRELKLMSPYPLRAIADELNRAGHRTRMGTPWRFEYVRSVLRTCDSHS
jgi:hypothetical protein